MSRDDPAGDIDRARRPLATLMLAAGLVAAAILIASLVFTGRSRGFDEAIILGLRAPDDLSQPIGPAWLRIALRDLTSLGSGAVLTVVTIIAAGYLAAARKGATALLLAGAAAGGGLLNTVLKDLFVRPRPELVAHLVDVHDTSFPSGHAMNSAVVYLTLGALLAQAEDSRRVARYVLAVAVALTLLVGGSRAYLGVHWPTDVLAGWAIGGAWAIGCASLARLLQRRRMIETPARATG